MALLLGLFVSASCLNTPPNRTPKSQLDASFTAWHEKQLSQASMQRELNRLSHPAVPLRLVYEGVAHPTILPGSAKTDALYGEATRLHNLDGDQQLRFMLNGARLPIGVPISESPLANTRNLEVLVMAAQVGAVRRSPARPVGVVASGESWWDKAASGSGQRRTAASRRADARLADAELTALIDARSIEPVELQNAISKAECAGANEELVTQAKDQLTRARFVSRFTSRSHTKEALEAALAETENQPISVP